MGRMASRGVMMKIYNLCRRTGMVLLFISAIYFTFATISNITLADMHVWMDKKAPEDAEADSAIPTKNKHIGIKNKVFNNVVGGTKSNYNEYREIP
jgi:hypothetical protein